MSNIKPNLKKYTTPALLNVRKWCLEMLRRQIEERDLDACMLGMKPYDMCIDIINELHRREMKARKKRNREHKL